MPNKIKVQVVDMEDDMKKDAVDTIDKTFQDFSNEGKIANEIRAHFDK